MIELCKVHHWTYQQYKANPTWFTDAMFMAEMETRKEQAKQNKASSKKR